MTETISKKKKSNISTSIPNYLVREVINETPYYYKGYQEVLRNEKNLEDIMGASGLQSLIIDLILATLYVKIGRKKYRFFSNESGNHLKKGSNLSFDIAIYDKKVLTADKINEFYVNVPPKVVIEVDVKIEVDTQSDMDYISTKTEKLLEYGTERIIWILSKSKKVIIAEPNSAWQIMNWNKSIELIESHSINIEELLKEDGLSFD